MTRRAGKRYAFSGTRPPQYFGIFSNIYKTKAMLPESIDAEMIYYEKVKDGIRVFLE
jgi:hypothetical protein